MTKVHEPTERNREDVQLMTKHGVTHAQIAAHIGISKKSLYKHYETDLEIGKMQAHDKVGKFLFNAASGAILEAEKKHGATYQDCLRAAMFYAKTQMGWRETDEVPQPGDIVIKRGVHPASKKKDD